ncbi:MAG: 50S ribosomal protein L3, partial [Candidatus Aenigmarchaeota archaeon CG_4_10_14_3_um_filter_37_21]
PNVSTWKQTDKLRVSGFAGYKAGMTQALIIDSKKNSPTSGEEILVPSTILDCPPLLVLGVRFYKQNINGFYSFSEVWDEKILKNKDLKRKLVVKEYTHKEKMKEIEKSLDEIKKIRLLIITQPRNSGIGKKTPEIFEIELTGKDAKEKFNYSKEILGKEIKAKDVFKEGEYVDVIGVSKGKGFQGVIKRWGVKMQNRKNMKKRRHIGTLGPETPRRVRWTVPMAGQLGFFKRTEYNKRIIKIGEDGKDVTPKSGLTGYGVVKKDYIVIEGSVPGPRKRLIMLRAGFRTPKVSVLPAEVKKILK